MFIPWIVMRRYWFCLLTVMMLFLSVSVHAVVVSGLYSVQVPVDSQAASLRNPAVLHAFKTVLVKVSGNSAVLNNSAVQAAFAQSSDYLQDYSYQKPSDDDQTVPASLLQVNFSDSAINQLLQSNGFTIWPANRPETLVWLVVKDQNQETFVRDGDNSVPAIGVLQKAFDARGLPIMFPVMDLSDTLQVTATDVTALNPATILNASERYQPDAILLVYLDMQNASQIAAHWQLIVGQTKQRWETDGADVNSVIQNGVDDIADALANQFTVTAGTDQQQQQLTLVINQLSGLSDYANLMQYLNQLSGVQKVEMLNLTPNSATFSIIITGALGTFQQIVRLDGKLKFVSADESNETLTYDYQDSGSRIQDSGAGIQDVGSGIQGVGLH